MTLLRVAAWPWYRQLNLFMPVAEYFCPSGGPPFLPSEVGILVQSEQKPNKRANTLNSALALDVLLQRLGEEAAHPGGR